MGEKLVSYGHEVNRYVSGQIDSRIWLLLFYCLNGQFRDRLLDKDRIKKEEF